MHTRDRLTWDDRSGLAPLTDPVAGEARLCGGCATLIRYWPADAVWRHVIVGIDHPPELRGSSSPLPRYAVPASIDAEPELVQRAMDGDR